jgi:hypothetical protein
VFPGLAISAKAGGNVTVGVELSDYDQASADGSVCMNWSAPTDW